MIRRHCSEIVSRLTRFAQRGLRKLRERLRDVSRPSHKSYGLAGDLARHDKERSGLPNSPSMKFRILIFCGRADSKSSVTSIQHPTLKIDASNSLKVARIEEVREREGAFARSLRLPLPRPTNSPSIKFLI